MNWREVKNHRNLHLALMALALFGSGGRCEDNRQAPELVWQDEFDGPAGASPDPTRWRFDIGTDWGNAQLEYDTARPSNVSLDGAGHLAITARREDYLGRGYTSARINTRGLFQQSTGRFEARIQMPVGGGLWPAFWLLGANYPTVSWPDCGEIDIVEYRGQEPNIIYGSVHGPVYSGGAAINRRFTLPGPGFDAAFHTFAVEWDFNHITWLVDDVPYGTVTPANIPARGRWVFDHPFFIILNLAVGGNFVGPVDPSTTFPQTMLVDWVRVQRLAP